MCARCLDVDRWGNEKSTGKNSQRQHLQSAGNDSQRARPSRSLKYRGKMAPFFLLRLHNRCVTTEEIVVAMTFRHLIQEEAERDLGAREIEHTTTHPRGTTAGERCSTPGLSGSRGRPAWLLLSGRWERGRGLLLVGTADQPGFWGGRRDWRISWGPQKKRISTFRNVRVRTSHTWQILPSVIGRGSY